MLQRGAKAEDMVGRVSVLEKPSKVLILFNEGSTLRNGINVLFRVAREFDCLCYL